MGGGTRGRRRRDELERAYLERLREFEAAEGRIAKIYWSTHAASAVAMTECARTKRWDPLRLREPDVDMRFHRVTDWLLEESGLPRLVQQCDVLASRVRQTSAAGASVWRWSGSTGCWSRSSA